MRVALFISTILLFVSCKSQNVLQVNLDCPTPSSLSCSIISETSLLLRWNKTCTEATSYVIERKSKNKFEEIAEQPADAIFYFDEDIDLVNQKYQYRVRAKSQNTVNPWSEILISPDVPNDMNDEYPFLINYPKGYDKDQKSKYPLMIFLHGAGERGTDLSLVEAHGPPKLLKEGKAFPCIVLAPQCPLQVYWQVNRLEKTLKKILKENRVDESRIYLTGLSMGGYGTWNWASNYPERFAAIAPICGGGDQTFAQAIKDIPTWVFHGGQDEIVPLSESQKMVDALMDIGGKPQFTIYPEANHDSWTITYNNQKLYNWLFSQHKAQ